MSIEDSMRIVELESFVRHLQMCLVEKNNAFRRIQIELADDDIDAARQTLKEVLGDEA